MASLFFPPDVGCFRPVASGRRGYGHECTCARLGPRSQDDTSTHSVSRGPSTAFHGACTTLRSAGTRGPRFLHARVSTSSFPELS